MKARPMATKPRLRSLAVSGYRAGVHATGAEGLLLEGMRLLDEGKVREVIVTDDVLRGELTEPIDGKTHFVTQKVEPELAEKLRRHGVEFSREQQSELGRALLSWLLPLALLLGFWFFMSRRLAGMGGVERHLVAGRL